MIFRRRDLEREQLNTRRTNRGAPRGIPRKTRSHQDRWMLALRPDATAVSPALLQLPSTINRDPAGGFYRKNSRGKGAEMWLVTSVHPNRPVLPLFSTSRSFPAWLSSCHGSLGKVRRFSNLETVTIRGGQGFDWRGLGLEDCRGFCDGRRVWRVWGVEG